MPTSTVCTPAPEDGGRPRDLTGLDRTILGLIARAGRDPGLTPPDKAVLLAVVAHADGNGVCKETDHTLARDSRTSVPTVQRALKLFQGQRVIERAYDPPEFRAIRLLPGEQSPVVDVVVDLDSFPDRERKQQQATARECSPESGAVEGRPPRPVGEPDPEFDRLVALLTDRNVTEKVARRLVRNHPERIIPQVEAHRHRNVSNPAASLVVAIRDDWPTDAPKAQRQPTAEERKEAARKADEVKRQTAHDAQSRLNARKRSEAKKVEEFWEGLTEGERLAFEAEAIEASPYRDQIRSLGPDDPLFTLQPIAARWEHVRRKLGLPPEAEA